MNPYKDEKMMKKIRSQFDNFETRESAQMSNIDLVVTRETATLANTPLPFILFGFQDLASGFQRQIARRFTGTSVTVYSSETGRLSATLNADYNDLIIKYTSGANNDIVRISCPNYPYLSLLRAISSNAFDVRNIRYSVSDPTLADAQFRNVLEVVKSSYFGSELINQVNINASKRPQQFQDGIVDITGNWRVNKETSFIGLINATALFSLSFSFFIPESSKLA